MRSASLAQIYIYFIKSKLTQFSSMTVTSVFAHILLKKHIPLGVMIDIVLTVGNITWKNKLKEVYLVSVPNVRIPNVITL